MNSPLRTWLVLGLLCTILGFWWVTRSAEQAPPVIASTPTEAEVPAALGPREGDMSDPARPDPDPVRRGHEIVDASPVLLRGVVTWADGVAARNASVSARIGDRELTRVRPFPSVVTGIDGTFEAMVPRAVHAVFATSGNCVSGVVEVDARRGDVAEVGIGMGRLPRLRGVLLDGLRRPVHGQVRVISRSESMGRKLERKHYLGADRRGDFRRDYALDVELEVQAEVAGAIATPAVVVPAGEVAHDLILRAVEVQPREFVVVDARGAPVRGAMLGVAAVRLDALGGSAVAWQRRPKTDESGRALIARTPVEDATVVRVTLGDGEGHFYETAVSTAMNPVEIHLPENALDAATVELAVVGELPFVAESMMLVVAEAEQLSSMRKIPFEAEARTLEITDLRAGAEYLFRLDVREIDDCEPSKIARDRSGSSDGLRKMLARTGGSTHHALAFGRVTTVRGRQRVELRVQEPRSLLVRLVQPGTSLREARAELRLFGPSVPGRGTHVAGDEQPHEGTWIFTGLVPGEHRVEVHRRGARLVERRVEIGLDGRTVLTLQLP